jgi:MFS family permease
LWTGESISFLGSAVSTVALPLVAVTRLHASPVAVTSLAAVAWLPWLVVGLPAGAWVDRLPRRAVMVVADVASMLALASVPIAAAFGVLSLAPLIIAAALAGVARVFFQTAYRAWLPTLVRTEDLVEANAKVQGSEQVAGLAGPGLAGLIAQVLTAVGGLVLDAASFAVSAFCLLRIRQSKPHQSAGQPGGSAAGKVSLRVQVRQGARIVAGDGLLRANALYGCLANFAIIGYESLLVPFLVDEVRFTPGAAGLLISAISVGGLIGAFTARRIAVRFGSARAVLIGKVALPPLGLLIPLAGHGAGALAFVAGNLAVTAGVVAGNIVFSGFVQSYVPSDYLGRVSSCTQLVNFCAIPFGALIAGGIATATSIRAALWVMTALLASAGAALVASPLRHLRDLPTGPLAPTSDVVVTDTAAAATHEGIR